jgi:hypothetical protein
MSIQEESAEDLAKLFHLYHQALGHGLDDHSTGESGTPWEQTPQNERRRMVAAARLALIDLAASGGEKAPSRRYFANPGEADWGC